MPNIVISRFSGSSWILKTIIQTNFLDACRGPITTALKLMCQRPRVERSLDCITNWIQATTFPPAALEATNSSYTTAQTET